MLNTYFSVPIPTDKVVTKKVQNITYVYYVSGCKRVPGFKNPRPIHKLIGKVAETPNTMYPNKNYFEIYGSEKTSQIVTDKITSYGSYLLYDQIITSIGLKELIEKYFFGKSDYLLALSHYMFTNGNIMMDAYEWALSNHTYYNRPLISGEISEFFKNIKQSDRMDFLKHWFKLKIDNSYIAYDVTSISTYSKGIWDATFGYNRDGEKLPQINLGIFLSEQTKLPLLYNSYDGSIIDKEQLPYILKVIDDYKLTNVKLVMDKGFYKEENLDLLNKTDKYTYILPIYNHYKLATKFIGNFHKSLNIVNHYIDDGIFGNSFGHMIDGKLIKVHVFVNEPKRAVEIGLLAKELLEDKEALSSKLKDNLNYQIESSIKLKFDIKGTDITVKPEYLKLRQLRAGMLVVLTDDVGLSSKEVLDIYRGKDPVEKCFDALKNDLEFERLHTHKQETTDGKLFVAFITLIAKMHLYNKLTDIQKELKDNTFGMKQIIKEMSKICSARLSNQDTLIVSPTRKHKVIMKHLGIDEERLKKLLDNLNDL